MAKKVVAIQSLSRARAARKTVESKRDSELERELALQQALLKEIAEVSLFAFFCCFVVELKLRVGSVERHNLRIPNACCRKRPRSFALQ